MNAQKEIWLPIARTNGAGLVSNIGRIKRAKTGRILKPFRKVSGYYCIAVGYPKSQTFSVARAVASAFVPNPDGKPEVNHINGIKADNRAVNLEWVTAAENISHAEKLLGRRFGARAHQKLTDAHVIAARALARTGGVSLSAIGRKFGVGLTCIHKAVRGDTWKHLNSTSLPVTK